MKLETFLIWGGKVSLDDVLAILSNGQWGEPEYCPWYSCFEWTLKSSRTSGPSGPEVFSQTLLAPLDGFDNLILLGPYIWILIILPQGGTSDSSIVGSVIWFLKRMKNEDVKHVANVWGHSLWVGRWLLDSEGVSVIWQVVFVFENCHLCTSSTRYLDNCFKYLLDYWYGYCMFSLHLPKNFKIKGATVLLWQGWQLPKLCINISSQNEEN